MTPQRMRAIVQDRFGFDALRVADIEPPVPADGQVLVRVRASCLNPADVAGATGSPLIGRPAFGMLRPKSPIRGQDFAGVVEAVGGGVAGLAVSDEVYGQAAGCFAEFVLAKEAETAPKPSNLTFEEAAAVPMVGLVALQALRKAGIGSGGRVLVIGAGGGIGSFAVQLAKARGATVTGVCGGSKAELVRSLGADRVIDYEREDVSADTERYDLILDNVSSIPLRRLRRLLAPNGLLLMNGGQFDHRWIGPMGRFLRGALLSRFGPGQITTFLSRPNRADLLELKSLIEAGSVRPVVSRTCSLAEVPAAIRDVASGHATGKVAVTVG